MPLKNYRYVFVTMWGEDVDVYQDERSLPSNVRSTHIRRAKQSPGEMHRLGGTTVYLGYMPVQGK